MWGYYPDPQQAASSCGRGGPDGRLEVRCPSHTTSANSSSQQSEAGGKKRITNRKLTKDESMLISGSTSDTASNSKSNDDSGSRFREELLATSTAGGVDASQASSSVCGRRRKGISNQKLSRDEVRSCSNDSDSDAVKHDVKIREAAYSSAAASSSCAAVPVSPAIGDAEQEDDDGDLQLDALPSVGAARHASGHCKPCLFLYESIGCKNGYLCSFCHFNHNRSSITRQSKGKRDRFRKLVSRLEALDNEPESTRSRIEDAPMQERQQPPAVGRVLSAGEEGGVSPPTSPPARRGRASAKQMMSL